MKFDEKSNEWGQAEGVWKTIFRAHMQKIQLALYFLNRLPVERPYTVTTSNWTALPVRSGRIWTPSPTRVSFPAESYSFKPEWTIPNPEWSQSRSGLLNRSCLQGQSKNRQSQFCHTGTSQVIHLPVQGIPPTSQGLPTPQAILLRPDTIGQLMFSGKQQIVLAKKQNVLISILSYCVHRVPQLRGKVA